MVKKTWLLCLFLFGIIALPVQSQTQLTNPTAAQLATCGLPATYSILNDSAPVKTFNMTADCTIDTSVVPNNGIYLHFQSGTFTINGNGHTINGPSHGDFAIIVGLNTQVTSTVLHLNNITIRMAPRANAPRQAVLVQRGARLNGRNIIFRENRGAHGAVNAYWGAKVYLENAQFLNNRQTHGTLGSASAATAYGGGGPAANTVLSITNGIFEGTRGVLVNQRVIAATGATVQLQGCIVFRDNSGLIYQASTLLGVAGVVTDTTTNQADRTRCPKPKRKKETATPRPSATPRPLATTCIDLHQATGIAVHATYGLASGVQCQRLGGGGIGLQSIVDAGFIDAVDIWGYVEQGVEVCFPQLGELLFLDARTMPRAVAPLASTAVNGMTCGAIETPGSIVLMPAG